MIIRLPFLGRFALVPDKGTADFWPGGLSWKTNLTARHFRNGILIAEYDFGSGKVTTDGVLNLAQDWTLTAAAIGAKAAPTFGGNSASGGFMSNGIYNYRVTALMPTGESTGTSAAVTLAAGGATQTQVINWALTTGAIGYKVYRTLVAGAVGTEKWVGTVGVVGAFTDLASDVTQAVGLGFPAFDSSNYPTLRAANYHDSGTDATADAAADFKLNVALTNTARATGLQTNPVAGQYQSVATILYLSTTVVNEWGIFNHSRSIGDSAISGLRATLWDRRQFAGVNVNSGDSVQYIYKLTCASGG